MNTQIAKGAMNELKGELKQTWAKLTDDDINYLDGNVDEIIGKVQRAYGFTRERAQEEFNRFKKSHANYFRDEREMNTKESKMATSFNSSVNPPSMSSIKNRTSQFASDIGDSEYMEPSEYMNKVREFGSVAMEKSTEFVKTYPGYTILGAAGVGFLLGAWFSRRN